MTRTWLVLVPLLLAACKSEDTAGPPPEKWAHECSSADDCRRRCENQDADACAALGILHMTGRGTAFDPEQATVLFTRACDAGSGIGCSWLARTDAGRDRSRQVLEKAAGIYERECAGRRASACSELGKMLERGEGAPVRLTRAYELYRRAADLWEAGCRAGHAPSCLKAGIVYRSGPGVRKDPDRALELMEKGCELDHAPSCAELASFVESGGDRSVMPDPRQVAHLRDRACTRGDADSCARLAGVTEDRARAAQLYQRACDLGAWADGCWMAAQAVLRGDAGGEAKTADARALANLEHSCAAGHADACRACGLLHEAGRGVPASPDAAAGFYQQACKARVDGGGTVCQLAEAEKECQGGQGAKCDGLGEFYAQGAGAVRDRARAEGYYRKACDARLPRGCGHLGRLLLDTEPQPSDAKIAAALLDQACTGGSPEDCERLAVLHEQGGPGLAADATRALADHDRACKLGSVAGCKATKAGSQRGAEPGEPQGAPKDTAQPSGGTAAKATADPAAR